MGKHPNLNTAIKAAVALVLLRLLAFSANVNWEMLDIAFVAVALAAVIPLAIYAVWPRENVAQGFLKQTAGAMRITAFYGLLITVFLFVFYSFIDREFFEVMQNRIIENELQNTPKEQHEKIRNNVPAFFSLGNFTAMVLILFIASAAFYSILFSALRSIIDKRKAGA
ncbi:MAG: DUF4199 domain-containing protein [Flavobacteriales bacterium]|nr:DUF4199 domain-containing protein [Flavobacteriales bacterium]